MNTTTTHQTGGRGRAARRGLLGVTGTLFVVGAIAALASLSGCQLLVDFNRALIEGGVDGALFDAGDGGELLDAGVPADGSVLDGTLQDGAVDASSDGGADAVPATDAARDGTTTG